MIVQDCNNVSVSFTNVSVLVKGDFNFNCLKNNIDHIRHHRQQ